MTLTHNKLVKLFCKQCEAINFPGSKRARCAIASMLNPFPAIHGHFLTHTSPGATGEKSASTANSVVVRGQMERSFFANLFP